MRAGTLVAVMVVPVLLAACEKTVSPAEKAAEDARAIAMVEAAQDVKAPPVPLQPQPLTAADFEQNRLHGPGCNLVPDDYAGDPVVVADGTRALLKIGGRLVNFAADGGSEPLAMGARTHYVGKAQSLVLTRGSGAGNSIGEDSERWDGSLTIRDANNQLVYTATGELMCGEQ